MPRVVVRVSICKAMHALRVIVSVRVYICVCDCVCMCVCACVCDRVCKVCESKEVSQ